MELSYTGLLNLYQALIDDNSSEARITGSSFLNLVYSNICARNKWIFMDGEAEIDLIQDEEKYFLPNDTVKVMNKPYTLIGTTKYPVTNVTSRAKWDIITANPQSASYPQFFFLTEDFMRVWPTPSDNTGTLVVPYQKKARKLSIEDYVTGSVTTLTNGGTTVITSGATLTASMIGRKIFFAEENGGDNQWYEISGIATNTITLKKPYQGASVVAGSIPVKIGQVPLIPEGFQEIIVYEAILLQNFQKELGRFNFVKVLRDEMWNTLKSTYSSNTTSTEIPDEDSLPAYNPNFFITQG